MLKKFIKLFNKTPYEKAMNIKKKKEMDLIKTSIREITIKINNMITNGFTEMDVYIPSGNIDITIEYIKNNNMFKNIKFEKASGCRIGIKFINPNEKEKI